ncbi:MAG: periplasmic sensor signal transduction histidine kinase, partial [Pseudomonadota bacterium]
QRRGRYVVDTLTPYLGDSVALKRELTRAATQMKLTISLYTADDRLIASSVAPPLAPGENKHPKPRVPSFPRPPRPMDPFRIPVESAAWPGAYAMYRPPPPPSPQHDPTLWTVGFALFATAFASILLARSFARPLSQLTAAASRFGRGELDVRAGLARKDEFGELSHAFDEMAERVTQLVRSRQQLLANVSHELRTPLARIRVALDLASDGDWQAELARDALSEIAEDCAELERLVSDVLQTARLDLTGQPAQVAAQILHKEPFDPVALVQRAVERFRNEHPGRALELFCPETLPELHGDQVLLRRVLSNLLDNAKQYSPDPTPVLLRVRVQDGSLEWHVEDRGIGIAPEDLKQVGTPFFRTDRSRTRRTGGVGLGLSLARGIVEAHGGTLTIESELDRGTRVCVRLPVRSVK